jgi:hypothetical protein
MATGTTVSLLAACSALVQPRAGRTRDARHLNDATGMRGGLALAAVGMALAALIPGVAGILATAVAIGTDWSTFGDPISKGSRLAPVCSSYVRVT